MKFVGLCCFVLLSQCSAFDAEDEGPHHHHKHHHKHHVETVVEPEDVASKKEGQLVTKMKALEDHLAAEQKATRTGHLLVNGPLPVDFSERFSQAAAEATGADAGSIKVTATDALTGSPGIMSVDFSASPSMVTEIEKEAAVSDSKLAKGNLHSFLVAPDEPEIKDKKIVEAPKVHAKKHSKPKHSKAVASEVASPTKAGLDIDTGMPYGDLEPFGREDTAQELTESAVTESDSMVDQLERAEVAEEKRAVFRALTRLRGAAITSFDGVARSQTGNIDEYNKVHKWRKSHPLHHLANEESDVNKWAFPNNADF